MQTLAALSVLEYDSDCVTEYRALYEVKAEEDEEKRLEEEEEKLRLEEEEILA